MKDQALHRLKLLFADPKVWVLLLFLARLESIDLPITDEHCWRESITLGVSRNYLEWDANFFHPRTVLCDSRSGIQAQEFPLLNYAITLMWKVFGEQNWCGRLLVLLVGSLGLLSFEAIVRRLSNSRLALFAMVILGMSVTFRFARKPMPDVFALSLVFMGIHMAYRYLENGRWLPLIGYFLLTALGLLSKMPMACLMPFLLPGLLDTEKIPRRRAVVLGVGAFSVAVMAAWYFLWVPWAEKTYGFPLFFAYSMKEGWQTLTEQGWRIWERFYPIALVSHIAFALFVIGIFRSSFKYKVATRLMFAAGAAMFLFFIIKSGHVFPTHTYYVIPIVPFMSLLAGAGLYSLAGNKNIGFLVLGLLTLESYLIQREDLFTPYHMRKFLKLEKLADEFIPKDSRILVNGKSGNPHMLYCAHRLGWSVDDRMKDTAWLKGESTVGLDFAIIDRESWRDSLPFPMLYQDNDFRIYKIKSD